MNYLQQEQSVAERAEKIVHRPANTNGDIGMDAQPPREPAVKEQFGPGDITPWTKSAVRAIAFVESRSARIAGVCGIDKDAGVDNISAAIAYTYANYDKRILYVETSHARFISEPGQQSQVLIDLAARCSIVKHNLYHADLSDAGLQLPQNTAFFRDTFAKALEDFDVILVNLPSATDEQGLPQPSSFTISSACDSTLLVCVTGRTTQAAIRQYMEGSKISGTNVEGILLNDAALPFNNTLANF